MLSNPVKTPGDLIVTNKPETPVETESKTTGDKINKYELWKQLNKVYFESLDNFGLKKTEEITKNILAAKVIKMSWLKSIISSKY
jgi:hypothetical protein